MNFKKLFWFLALSINCTALLVANISDDEDDESPCELCDPEVDEYDDEQDENNTENNTENDTENDPENEPDCENESNCEEEFRHYVPEWATRIPLRKGALFKANYTGPFLAPTIPSDSQGAYLTDNGVIFLSSAFVHHVSGACTKICTKCQKNIVDTFPREHDSVWVVTSHELPMSQRLYLGDCRMYAVEDEPYAFYCKDGRVFLAEYFFRDAAQNGEIYVNKETLQELDPDLLHNVSHWCRNSLCYDCLLKTADYDDDDYDYDDDDDLTDRKEETDDSSDDDDDDDDDDYEVDNGDEDEKEEDEERSYYYL